MHMKQLILAVGLGALSGMAMAANPLSVHVLNLETGVPSSGVEVTLEQHVGPNWQMLAQGTTNEQGRIGELFPAGRTFEQGEYRVVFKTGDYYQRVGHETFFPEIPVIFKVRNTDQHYHIPLLLSPYGFSTYRGS